MRKEILQRDKEIVRLREKKHMKFKQIAEQFHITTSRAHQIYSSLKPKSQTIEHSTTHESKHIRVTVDQVAKAFRTTPENLEVVIPQKGYIIKV